uniref:BET1 homolog n=1 Tax=Glossina palpalis gambiensis TaxID=67801 RepID=A0A1B0B6X1_9MUSC
MRRNNYPYQPLTQTSTDNSRVAVSQDALEEENERSAEELKQKIGALKSLTIDIGHEVRYQDKLLRGIDDDMDRTHGFLSNTMGRVVRLGKNTSSRHIPSVRLRDTDSIDATLRRRSATDVTSGLILGSDGFRVSSYAAINRKFLSSLIRIWLLLGYRIIRYQHRLHYHLIIISL